MKKISNPKNQYQQVLWYLSNWSKPFSLAEVIDHSMFYKFQTRLSEMENNHMILIADRSKVKFRNVFGNSSNFNTYKICISEEKLKELFEYYN